MRISAILTAIASLAAAKETLLYVSSYDGNVSTLALGQTGNTSTLEIKYRNTDCAPSPTWLTLDKQSNTLYCLDEGNTTPTAGSLTTFSTSDNGTLVKQGRVVTAPAPVNGVLFGSKNFSAYAVAHYTGQVSAILVQDASTPKVLQSINLTMTKPGPSPNQAGPHAHQAILDPTGQYILVPDLGADLVRVYCWAAGYNETLLAHEPLAVPSGMGPRHAVFWSPDDTGKSFNGTTTTAHSTKNLYLAVLGELSSDLVLYRATYNPGVQAGMSFEQVSSQKSYSGTPHGTPAAGELAVSPDNRFLTLSNRNDSSIPIRLSNATPGNTTITTENSDSLAVFKLQQPANATAAPSSSAAAAGTNATASTNGLPLSETVPAGGSFPRSFAINKAGDMLAVALQNSARVVIWHRDVQTGDVGPALAAIDVSGSPTCVIWDE